MLSVIGGLYVANPQHEENQAEDGIRDAQESRGLGDVYKRQIQNYSADPPANWLA